MAMTRALACRIRGSHFLPLLPKVSGFDLLQYSTTSILDSPHQDDDDILDDSEPLIPVKKLGLPKGKFVPSIPFSFRDELSSLKNVHDAYLLFCTMASRRRRDPQSAYDAVEYAQLLTTVMHNFKHYSAVVSLFKEMRFLGLPISHITLNILMTCYCSMNCVASHGFSVLSLYFKLGHPPDVVTFNILVDGLGKAGQIEEARKVFDGMIFMGIEPDMVIYSSLINRYCVLRKMNEASCLFEDMLSKGLMPSIATFTAILQGFFRVGRCAAAYKLLAQLNASGPKPNFYTHCVFLDGMFKNGLVEMALSYFHEIESKGVDLHIGIYSIVIDGLCKHGKLEHARHMFSSLSSKMLDPTIYTYNIMINGLCLAGLMEEAKDMLRTMEKKGCFPDCITYSIIVQGFLKSGKSCEAMEVLEEMVDRGFSPPPSTVSLLINLCPDAMKVPALVSIIQKCGQDDR